MLRLAPAAPLAAKAMADKAVADMAGVSLLGGNPGAPSASGMIAYDQAVQADAWKAKVLRFLANGKLPDWVDDHIRKNNQHVGFLDPDIASKRSWSFNVKVAAQRERNIERQRQNIVDGPKRQLLSQEFQQTWGVWI